MMMTKYLKLTHCEATGVHAMKLHKGIRHDFIWRNVKKCLNADGYHEHGNYAVEEFDELFEFRPRLGIFKGDALIKEGQVYIVTDASYHKLTRKQNEVFLEKVGLQD